MNIQGWFPLRLTDLTSLLSKGLSGAFSSITVQRHQFCGPLPSSWSCSHKHVTNGKTIASTIWTFVSRVMSLLFNTLFMFFKAFLARTNRLLISWLQSPSTVLLEAKMRKSVTASTFSPSICHEAMGVDPMTLVF